jgi:hypothetical protein
VPLLPSVAEKDMLVLTGIVSNGEIERMLGRMVVVKGDESREGP